MNHQTQILFIAVLTAPAAAQYDPAPIEQPRGVFAASPLALLFEDSGNSPGGASGIHWKLSGAGAPTAILPQFPAPSMAAPAVPDFRFASIVAALGNALGVVVSDLDLEIDALSTGNDRTPARWDEIQGQFVFDPGFNVQWSGAMFSVRHTAAPRPSGSWLGFRTSQLPGGPGLGAEIVSTYAEGSSPAIPAPNLGYLEQGADDFAAGTFPAPSGRPEIVGLDLFIPFIIERLGQPDPVLMPTTNQLLFSLTAASAALIDARNPSLNGNPVTVTGATIFRLVWSSSALSWVTLEIPVSHTDLGLAPDDDIDALAVGGALAGTAGNITGTAYMFSLRRFPATTSSLLPQLLMFAPEVVLPNGSLDWRIGEPVDRNGLRLPAAADITLEDDIDAICNPDPERSLQYGEIIGLPTAQITVPSSQGVIGLSMSHDYGNQVLRCVVSGRDGVNPDSPPVAALAVEFELPNLFPGMMFRHIVPTLRGPLDHTFQFTAPLPPPGADMHAYVLQRSADGTIQRSWPLEMSF